MAPEAHLTRKSSINNLDAIISIGYRVNSFRATKFRIWATQVLKQYMLKGFAINRNAVSEQKYEDLKKAVGLLENAFSKENCSSLPTRRRIYSMLSGTTPTHSTRWTPMITRVSK